MKLLFMPILQIQFHSITLNYGSQFSKRHIALLGLSASQERLNHIAAATIYIQGVNRVRETRKTQLKSVIRLL